MKCLYCNVQLTGRKRLCPKCREESAERKRIKSNIRTKNNYYNRELYWKTLTEKEQLNLLLDYTRNYMKGAENGNNNI